MGQASDVDKTRRIITKQEAEKRHEGPYPKQGTGTRFDVISSAPDYTTSKIHVHAYILLPFVICSRVHMAAVRCV